MDEEYIKGLYSHFGGESKLGKFDDFKEMLSTDQEYRQGFYETLGGQEVFGQVDDFNALVSLKKKEVTPFSQPSQASSLVSSLTSQEGSNQPLVFQPQPFSDAMRQAGIQFGTQQETKPQAQWSDALPQGSMTGDIGDLPQINLDQALTLEKGPELKGTANVERPYRPDMKGFVLNDAQLKSRLKNDKLKPWMFSGANDPWADQGISGVTPKEFQKDVDWDTVVYRAEQGLINPEEYLNYEGMQMLNHLLKEKRNAKMQAEMLVGEGEEILTPIKGSTGGENKLYDLETYEEVEVSREDIEEYLDQQAQRLFGTINFFSLQDDQQKYVLEKFSEKYTDEGTLKKMFEDAGLDFDVSRLRHAYSAFSQGALGMATGAANQLHRMYEGYMDILNDINPMVDNELSPLGAQRYWEDQEYGYAEGKKALEKKYLSAIGAGKGNPKYQQSFWLNTLPSGLGSVVGMIASTGGKPAGMALEGSLAGGDMQASQAVQKGGSMDEAFWSAMAGMGIGATEAIPFARMFSRMSSPVKQGILKSMAKGAIEEGAQEYVAGVLNNAVAKMSYDEKKNVLGDKQTIEEGLAGALIGGAFGAGGAVVSKKQSPKDVPTDETRQDRLRALYERDKTEVGEKGVPEQAGETAQAGDVTTEVQSEEKAKDTEQEIQQIQEEKEGPILAPPPEGFNQNKDQNAGLPQEEKASQAASEAESQEVNPEEAEIAPDKKKVDDTQVEEKKTEETPLGELSFRKRTKTETRKRVKKLRRESTRFDNGTYSIVEDTDGLHVVNNETNLPTESKRVKRQIHKQYIRENFDKFEDPDAVTEAAAVWDANRPKRMRKGRVNMGIETIIHDEGLQMSREDFGRYGDPNAITDQMVKSYNMDERDSGIDARIKAINNEYFGDESNGITPEDIVDYMVKYPDGDTGFRKAASQAKQEGYEGVDLDERDRAKAKFKELTGIELTDAVANEVFAMDSERMMRNPEEEARIEAEGTLNQEQENISREAAAQEKREVQVLESIGARGVPPGEGRNYVAPDGDGKKRKKALFNRVLQDPEVSQKVKDELANIPKEYTQQRLNTTMEIAREAVRSLKRAGTTLSDIFDIIADDGVIPNSVDRFAMAQVVAYEARQRGQEELAAEVYLWLDNKARDAGRAIQTLVDRSPEALIRRSKEEGDFKMEEALSKEGKSGKTLDQELTEVYNEAKVKVEDVDKAMESDAVQEAMDRMKNGIQPEPAMPKRVSDRKKKKDKIKAAKKKVSDGIQLLKGLDQTAQMSLVGMSPNQVKGLRMIAEGLIEQGLTRFSLWKDAFVNALKGYNVDAEALAVELWNDTSLGESYSNQTQDIRKAEAIEALANRIASKAKGKKPSTDLLDRIVSELTAKAMEVIPKTKQEKVTATERVAEMVRNEKLAQEVWYEARIAVREKIQADSRLDDVQKAEVLARLDDYFSMFSGEPFGRTRARQMIKEGAFALNEKVKDIARQHYARAEGNRRSLAEKLVERTGVTGDAAVRLQDALVNELRSMNQEQQQKIIDQQLGKSRIPWIKKQNRSITERAVELINMGVLSDKDFKGLFGKKYGFPELNPELESQLLEIVDMINIVEEGEYRRKKMSEFKAMLDKLDNKHTAFYVGRLITEHMYMSILSGVSTLIRAGGGAAMSVTADMIGSTLVNAGRALSKGKMPVLAVKGLGAYIRGMKKGYPFFKDTIKNGYSELEATDDQGNYSILREVVNKPILDSIKDYKNAKSKGEKAKQVGNIIYKSLFYLPAKMTRTLIATDALFHYGQKEYYTMVESYNQVLADGKLSKDSKKLWTEVHKMMVDGANFREQAEIQAEQEVLALEQAGETVSKNYFKKRVTELIEKGRDDQVQEYARWRAKKGTLTNKPMYTAGNVLYPVFTKLTSPGKDASPGEVFMKTMLKFVFPILRVPTNHINMWLDYTPIGVVRAFTQVPKGDFTDTMRADLRAEHLMKAGFGMAFYAWLFTSMFDMEDEELKLKEDSWIKITAEGWTKSRGYLYDKSISSDRKDWSLQVKLPDFMGGGWSEPFNYRDTPFGFLFSSLGYMSDALQYNEREDRPKVDDRSSMWAFYATKGILAPLVMIKEQNYMQGLDNLDRVTRRGQEMQGFMDLLVRPVKTMYSPNIYVQADKIRRDLAGVPASRARKYKDDFTGALYDNMFKNFPVLDQYVADKQFDQLGYPIVAKFEMPYVPEKIFDYMRDIFNEQNKDEKAAWKLIYKYPEVSIGEYISIRDMKGVDDIDHDDRRWFEEKAANLLRERIESNYGLLDQLGPDALQKTLNKLKNDVRKVVRGQFYDKKMSETD